MVNRNFKGTRKQTGFTLVEVLVATVVLSIGLIGVAGLQAASLSNNQSAFMRSQASALAYDLADRMRANVSSATANLYDPAASDYSGSCKTTTGCAPQDMAEHDLAEWNTTMATYLPMGQGFVCIDSTPNDGASAAAPACDGTGTQFAIKIWWDDNRDNVVSSATGNDEERLVISAQL